MVKDFNDNNFSKDALEASSGKPVLVDFYAAWCGPCKMQGPIIDQVAEEIGDKAIIGKINVEESPNISEQYEVMSIPTIILFKEGKIIEKYSGLQSKDSLLAEIKKHL